MARKKPTTGSRPDDDGTPGLLPEGGVAGRAPAPGALDDTVAEVVVAGEEEAVAPLSLGAAAPGAGAGAASAFEPWLHQLDGQYDPEAGIQRVADKRFSLRRIAPPGSLGQVILSLVWFLVAVNLAIMAIILQDPWYVYSAPVITPLGLFMAVRLFRRWKGHRKLTLRIEETLDGPAAD